MPTVREVELLKQEVENLKQQIAQQQGRLAELKRQWKDSTHGWSSEQLREHIATLEQQRVEADEALQEKLREYRAKYKERFGRGPRI